MFIWYLEEKVDFFKRDQIQNIDFGMFILKDIVDVVGGVDFFFFDIEYEVIWYLELRNRGWKRVFS